MTTRGPHATRTKLEAAVCEEMGRQRLEHEHRSLRFRVGDDPGTSTKYAPSIVARRGPILFLVEPLAAVTRPAIQRLARFLEAHSPEIVLVVVAPDVSVRRVPPEAYDEIYPESGVARMTERIRSQDPEGIVLPFDKPSPRSEGH